MPRALSAAARRREALQLRRQARHASQLRRPRAASPPRQVHRRALSRALRGHRRAGGRLAARRVDAIKRAQAPDLERGQGVPCAVIPGGDAARLLQALLAVVGGVVRALDVEAADAAVGAVRLDHGALRKPVHAVLAAAGQACGLAPAPVVALVQICSDGAESERGTGRARSCVTHSSPRLRRAAKTARSRLPSPRLAVSARPRPCTGCAAAAAPPPPPPAPCTTRCTRAPRPRPAGPGRCHPCRSAPLDPSRDGSTRAQNPARRRRRGRRL